MTWSGDCVVIGLLYMHIISNQYKFTIVFLSNATISFDCKFNTFKSTESLNMISLIWVILLDSKFNSSSSNKPLNEAKSIDDIWLFCKTNFLRDVNEINVNGSILDIRLEPKSKCSREDKPLKVATSINDIWFWFKNKYWAMWSFRSIFQFLFF